MRDVSIRRADFDDHVAVVRLLEGALLDVSSSGIRSGIDDGRVLVAISEDIDAGEHVLGALVLDGTHVEAIAVRPSRRRQGVGTALIEAARAETDEPLTARFDPDVRGFYEALGFDIERCKTEDRLRGQH